MTQYYYIAIAIDWFSQRLVSRNGEKYYQVLRLTYLLFDYRSAGLGPHSHGS